jgi:hypothetical protein
MTAVPPVFVHEPEVTEMVADWRSGPAPEIVAFDSKRSWMLMRDMGRHSLESIRDIEYFPGAPDASSIANGIDELD